MYNLYTFKSYIKCPITDKIYYDPVTFMYDENIYERFAIEKWLVENNISPVTGIIIRNTDIIPMILFRNHIKDILTKYPYLKKYQWNPLKDESDKKLGTTRPHYNKVITCDDGKVIICGTYERNNKEIDEEDNDENKCKSCNFPCGNLSCPYVGGCTCDYCHPNESDDYDRELHKSVICPNCNSAEWLDGPCKKCKEDVCANCDYCLICNIKNLNMDEVDFYIP